jgi:hypothetical protein
MGADQKVISSGKTCLRLQVVVWIFNIVYFFWRQTSATLYPSLWLLRLKATRLLCLRGASTHIFGLARACTDWEQTLCWLSLCSGCMLWEIRRVGAEAVQEAVPVHSTGNSSMDSEADDGRRRQRFPFCNLKDVKLEALLAALLRSAPRCCPFGMVLQQLSPAHPHLHVSGDQDGNGCADVRAVWCRQLARFAGRS